MAKSKLCKALSGILRSIAGHHGIHYCTRNLSISWPRDRLQAAHGHRSPDSPVIAVRQGIANET